MGVSDLPFFDFWSFTPLKWALNTNPTFFLGHPVYIYKVKEILKEIVFSCRREQKIFWVSRAVWRGLRKTMRRWHCGGEMKGEERGELLNFGDQDIAGWKLNFVTNVEIIEGEIKEGSQHQPGQLDWSGTTEQVRGQIYLFTTSVKTFPDQTLRCLSLSLLLPSQFSSILSWLNNLDDN